MTITTGESIKKKRKAAIKLKTKVMMKTALRPSQSEKQA